MVNIKIWIILKYLNFKVDSIRQTANNFHLVTTATTFPTFPSGDYMLDTIRMCIIYACMYRVYIIWVLPLSTSVGCIGGVYERLIEMHALVVTKSTLI